MTASKRSCSLYLFCFSSSNNSSVFTCTFVHPESIILERFYSLIRYFIFLFFFPFFLFIFIFLVLFFSFPFLTGVLMIIFINFGT